MNRQEPTYELQVSRLFHAPPLEVRRAITDPELRAEWLPTASRPIPDPTESAQDGPLTWTDQLGPSGGASNGPVISALTVRVELREEPRGKTLLELRAGPYNKAGEIDARAWWDSAFSHLDTLLEGNEPVS